MKLDDTQEREPLKSRRQKSQFLCVRSVLIEYGTIVPYCTPVPYCTVQITRSFVPIFKHVISRITPSQFDGKRNVLSEKNDARPSQLQTPNTPCGVAPYV